MPRPAYSTDSFGRRLLAALACQPIVDPQEERNALIGAVARDLYDRVMDYHDKSGTRYDDLPPAEQRQWLLAATNALEWETDRIIEHGRPDWWSS